jgi:hypothetical protein
MLTVRQFPRVFRPSTVAAFCNRDDARPPSLSLSLSLSLSTARSDSDEVDEAFGWFGGDELHSCVVADVEALFASDDSAFGGWGD